MVEFLAALALVVGFAVLSAWGLSLGPFELPRQPCLYDLAAERRRLQRVRRGESSVRSYFHDRVRLTWMFNFGAWAQLAFLYPKVIPLWVHVGVAIILAVLTAAYLAVTIAGVVRSSSAHN